MEVFEIQGRRLRAAAGRILPVGQIARGLAIRYISPDVVQQGGARDMVLLARGRDDYGHFDIVGPATCMICHFGESTVHSESMARRTRNVLPAGAGGKR